MARDGWVLERVYAALHPGEPRSYVLGSRCAVQFAELTSRAAVLAELDRAQPHHSVREALARAYHLSPEQFWPDSVAELSPEALETPLARPESRRLLERITYGIADVVVERARSHQARYAEYVERACEGRRPIVVDIGYRGTAQRHIHDCLNRRVDGLYIVTHAAARSVANVGAIHGYDATLVDPRDRSSVVNHNRYLIEALLSSTDAPFLHFDPAGTPVFDRSFPDPCSKAIGLGVLEGVEAFGRDYARGERTDADLRRGAALMRRILTDPSAEDAAVFAGLAFDDWFAGIRKLYVVAPDEQRDGCYALWVEGQHAIDRIRRVNGYGHHGLAWRALTALERSVARRAMSTAMLARFVTHRERFLSEARHPGWRAYSLLTRPLSSM